MAGEWVGEKRDGWGEGGAARIKGIVTFVDCNDLVAEGVRGRHCVWWWWRWTEVRWAMRS